MAKNLDLDLVYIELEAMFVHLESGHSFNSK